MKKIMSGLLALAWLAVAVPGLAQANSGYAAYKPGLVKAAVAKNQTVVLFY